MLDAATVPKRHIRYASRTSIIEPYGMAWLRTERPDNASSDRSAAASIPSNSRPSWRSEPGAQNGSSERLRTCVHECLHVRGNTVKVSASTERQDGLCAPLGRPRLRECHYAGNRAEAVVRA